VVSGVNGGIKTKDRLKYVWQRSPDFFKVKVSQSRRASDARYEVCCRKVQRKRVITNSLSRSPSAAPSTCPLASCSFSISSSRFLDSHCFCHLSRPTPLGVVLVLVSRAFSHAPRPYAAFNSFISVLTSQRFLLNAAPFPFY
jgi:hypothetical protein